jgi:hypothetical protein
MEHDHRYVLHGYGYVSEGRPQKPGRVSLVAAQPWSEKFRGPSKQGLEQAALRHGFFHSLNLTVASVHGLVDFIAVPVFR